MLLSILVLLATQPLQASVCDLSADQNSSHHSMLDDDMHAGMAHDIDGASDKQIMDCCADEPGSDKQNCSAMAQCGAAPAGLATLNPAIVSAWLSASSGKMPTLSQVPPNQFSSPPFRPPIY